MRQAADRSADRKPIADGFGRGAGSGLRILESLYRTPFITVAQAAERLGIRFQAARNLIQRFVDADLLVEFTGQERYRVYQYAPYVRLLSDVGRLALPAFAGARKLKRKPSPPLTAFMADEIRRLKAERGLYNHQIAALLGINQGRVSEVLTGKRFPPTGVR